MSDFYNEQSDQIAVFKGSAGQPAGHVTIQGPKMHTLTQEPIFDIQDYSGQIYYGQTQLYCEPKETEFRFSGTRPAQLILAGNFWYNSRPVFKSQPNAHLTLLGNSGAQDSTPSASDLAAVSAALDDLRRLGEVDYRLSQEK
jgi:hypothetical protein